MEKFRGFLKRKKGPTSEKNSKLRLILWKCLIWTTFKPKLIVQMIHRLVNDLTAKMKFVLKKSAANI